MGYLTLFYFILLFVWSHKNLLEAWEVSYIFKQNTKVELALCVPRGGSQLSLSRSLMSIRGNWRRKKLHGDECLTRRPKLSVISDVKPIIYMFTFPRTPSL